ncbi:DNA replication and repair protein RecO [Mariprofundus aestuarium]|uniref:DNA repair protein RecO n=2 Tax=Mariprofundus aestuarium TaxID=1921086 RepID=A0A2K8L336_MARES|nr:DNA replication and repair protein RecO [Mariprofundus aestuarium]
MARGARRPRSPFRASLEPLCSLQISWRPGRTGMGMLTDIQRGQSLLEASQSLDGLELIAIASRLFQEGDPHGFEETVSALSFLAARKQQQGLLAAVWHMLDLAGWLGNLFHCWQCGDEVAGSMSWQHGHLLCENCLQDGGNRMPVSAGLRKSIAGVLEGCNIQLSVENVSTWREIIRLVLKEHGLKATDSFKAQY